MKNLIIAFLILSLCAIKVASADNIPDRPSDYITDLAGIIKEQDRFNLSRFLRELEEKTTAQIFILTVKSLEGRPVEQVSLETAEKWKPGQKGRDNGVLILVALSDRKYRFEIGYGLEPVLPDSFAGSVGREYIVPYFRKGDYSGGITGAAAALAEKIAAEANIRIEGIEQKSLLKTAPGTKKGKEGGIVNYVFSIIFLVLIVYLFIRHPRLLLLLLFMSGGSGRNSGWGGGGFSSGGFGGGGGSFGGGGASGSW